MSSIEVDAILVICFMSFLWSCRASFVSFFTGRCTDYSVSQLEAGVILVMFYVLFYRWMPRLT